MALRFLFLSLLVRFTRLLSKTLGLLINYTLFVGRGGASGLNRLLWGGGLFEPSEFLSHLSRCRGGVYPKGREREGMVLGTFAETKELRRAGTKPRINYKMMEPIEKKEYFRGEAN